MPDSTSDVSAQELLRLFDYDLAAPLDVQTAGVEHRDGVAIHDVTFAGPLRPKIPAYLVVPSGAGPFAGIVFGHWYEPRAPTNNRTQFLDEAVAMAHAGAASLLVEGLFPWYGSPSANEADYDRKMVAHSVIELRRAVDVLTSRSDIDTARLAFAGHDFNAMHGSILAAIDARLKVYVFMAGTPRYADWFLKYWSSYLEGEQREAYLRDMAAVDPISHVGQASHASLFFQFARNDFYVPEAVALEYYGAASEPKRLEWYDAEHEMNEAAKNDRTAWLKEQLGLNRR